MRGRHILTAIIGVFIINTANGQHRDGIEISQAPVGFFLKKTYNALGSGTQLSQLVQFPSLGYYHQHWIDDRYCRYQSLTYQGMHGTLLNPLGRLDSKAQVNLFNFTWGKLGYFKHREFDDDHAWFMSYALSIGYGHLRYQTYKQDGSGAIKDSQKVPFGQFTLYQLGFGYEKKLSEDYQMNASAEISIGTLPNLSLHFRIMKNRF
ncbi:MAG: hypothetical protein GC180_02140 [Bacteroidetes bacterium]|nr:hypothetical protein [Bacteroidota bacterium]